MSSTLKCKLACTEKAFVIPGTWAQEACWCRDGGFFYDMLVQSAKQHRWRIACFSWSGKLGHEECLKAGRRLADQIEGEEYKRFHIVAHSRGAHVAIVASQELKRRKSIKRIGALYMLGAPIDSKNYMPAMRVIERVYNLFSLADVIQPLFGLYRQVFPPHPRIVNLRVFVDHNAPDHSHMHDPIIGRYLLDIHEKFAQQRVGNFDQFSFENPGVIHFYQNATPCYEIDHSYEMVWRNMKRLP